MDKRLKHIDEAADAKARQALYDGLRAGTLSLPQAIRAMRRISHLTQAEFAAHRGVSVETLKLLERGQGNPTVETLNKIVSVFGLQVGLVARPTKASRPARAAD